MLAAPVRQEAHHRALRAVIALAAPTAFNGQCPISPVGPPRGRAHSWSVPLLSGLAPRRPTPGHHDGRGHRAPGRGDADLSAGGPAAPSPANLWVLCREPRSSPIVGDYLHRLGRLGAGRCVTPDRCERRIPAKLRNGFAPALCPLAPCPPAPPSIAWLIHRPFDEGPQISRSFHRSQPRLIRHLRHGGGNSSRDRSDLGQRREQRPAGQRLGLHLRGQ